MPTVQFCGCVGGFCYSARLPSQSSQLCEFLTFRDRKGYRRAGGSLRRWRWALLSLLACASGSSCSEGAILPWPRGSLNRVVPKATHLTTAQALATHNNARCIEDGRLTGVTERLWIFLLRTNWSRQALCCCQQPVRAGVQQRLIEQQLVI